jgi:hypothetical protein
VVLQSDGHGVTSSPFSRNAGSHTASAPNHTYVTEVLQKCYKRIRTVRQSSGFQYIK